MKKILKLTMFLAALVCLSACDKPEEPVEKDLEVNVHNIVGEWRLESLNGTPLADGLYVYMLMESSGQKFTLFQNSETFKTEIVTGRFNITYDQYGRSELRGIYDHSMSAEWKHRYKITSLTRERMVWEAIGASEVQEFVRTAIPDDMKAQAKKEDKQE